ncbi:hypothetical protein [Mesorhizobium sp.]|uniref:hypothetical protein n=1 Tax=Mesorhizobium sp. TaxID=1871066 RepID=UPI0011F7FFD9|nr:hypothetical protein [Mesorhizobium sp.]TIN80722.1 MAG: hypothetical protein E5Y09_02545 [Mesorhizobium sp.]
MTIQTLSQDELDDAYHCAVFDCDHVLSDVIRRMFLAVQEQIVAEGISLTYWATFRDDLHNEIAQAFNECELKHMGGQRYDALMARLWAGKKPEASPQ